MPDVDLGRIENEFAGAASQAGNAARDAFAAAFETDTFAAPDFGLSAFAEDARAAADSARETATALGELAGAPLASIAALREAMAGANTEIDNAAGANSNNACTRVGPYAACWALSSAIRSSTSGSIASPVRISW